MESFSWLLVSTGAPVLTALVLGFLVAIDSCTLATSITAIGYVARDMHSKRQAFLNGIFYTLGRMATYLILCAVLIAALRRGFSIAGVQSFLGSYGGRVVGPLFIAVGLFMIAARWLRLPSLPIAPLAMRLKIGRGVGAFLLGMLFALAICPAIGFLFFGGLIPLLASRADWFWLAVIFSMATALPVVIVAWLLAFSVARVGTFYSKMQRVQRWLNIAVAVLFIVAGIELLLESFGAGHHDHAEFGVHGALRPVTPANVGCRIVDDEVMALKRRGNYIVAFGASGYNAYLCEEFERGVVRDEPRRDG